MAYLNYTVFWNTSAGATVNKLSNVQTIQVEQGRQWAVDPYSPSQCTIVARTTTAPKIGQFVLVVDGDLSSPIPTQDSVFAGTVKDIATTYGNVSNMDYVTIQCEGWLSRWGRKQFTSRSIAQAGTLTQLSTLRTALGWTAWNDFNGSGRSTASAQTYQGNGLDLVNELLATEMGYVFEIGTYEIGGVKNIQSQLYFGGRSSYLDKYFSFTDDTTTGTNHLLYDSIDFASAAQRYYTEVTINPSGLASQTAGSGFYGLNQNSLDYTTGQALNHAQYLVSQYDSQDPQPFSITLTYANQDTSTRRTRFESLVNTFFISNNRLVTLRHRGTDYDLVYEGKSVTIDPGDTIIQLYFSPADNNNYLILNDTTFGRLNYNKLGF